MLNANAAKPADSSREERMNRVKVHFEGNLAKGNWTREIAGDDYDVGVNGIVKAYDSSTDNHKLGIIITGEYGCGKTSFVRAAFPRARIVNCVLPEEVRYVRLDEYPDYVRELMECDVIIDDLGAETFVNEYGIKRDVIGDFICRYHLFGKGRLIITTNLRGKELLEKYGGRVGSRLKDLCVPIRFNGKDKREWCL